MTAAQHGGDEREHGPPPVLALDVGSTKVEAMIARAAKPDAANPAAGPLDVLGWAEAPSPGVRKGVVVHLEATTDAVRRVVEEARRMAGMDLAAAYVSLAGGHIRGVNSRGTHAVSGPDYEVTREDVEKVIESAGALAIPMDREVIHILPQEFILDGTPGIKDPLGMRGRRLEAEVHIVTGAVAAAQNLVKAVNDAGVFVEDLVLESLAASAAVLSEDEKEMGVILLNLGGGTTEVAVFVEGSLWQTEVIGLGGDNVTRDISVCLRAPLAQAEELKKKHGVARRELVGDDEVVEIPSVGGRPARPLDRSVLVEIIEPRVQEILFLVQRTIRRGGYEDLAAAGVVLTGGTAEMRGVQETAEEILQMPVRTGAPTGLGGLASGVAGPAHATVVGLVRHGLADEGRAAGGRGFAEPENLFQKIVERMKSWF